MDYTVILYPILAILPNYIWLLFFLKKDKNPEPKLKVLFVFFLGMVATLPAGFLESFFLRILDSSNINGYFFFFIKYFLIIGLIEELFKYLGPRLSALNSSAFDQPIDIPLYLIISALGFGAIENILGILSLEYSYFFEPFVFVFCRFLTATFFHAIASGILGIFIAFAYLNLKKKNLIISLGILTATLLHGFYNYSIINIKYVPGHYLLNFFIPIIILIFILVGGGIFLKLSFKKLRKIKSICKIK